MGVAPRFIAREEWLAGIKGVQTASGDAGVWRAASFAQLVPSEIQGNAIHWPGGDGNVARAVADPFKYVQTMQIQYRNVHQFDIGYNWIVTPNGWVFECRGWFRSASQDEPGNTLDENGIAPSVLIVTDLDGVFTPEQQASTQWCVANTRFVFPLAKWIKGHREIGNNSTVCPGDRIISFIHAGAFEPQEDTVVTLDPASVTAVANAVRTNLGVPTGKTVQQATVDELMVETISTPWGGVGHTNTVREVLFYILRNASALYLGEPLTGSTVTNPGGFWPKLVNDRMLASQVVQGQQTQALTDIKNALGSVDPVVLKQAITDAVTTAIGNADIHADVDVAAIAKGVADELAARLVA